MSRASPRTLLPAERCVVGRVEDADIPLPRRQVGRAEPRHRIEPAQRLAVPLQLVDAEQKPSVLGMTSTPSGSSSTNWAGNANSRKPCPTGPDSTQRTSPSTGARLTLTVSANVAFVPFGTSSVTFTPGDGISRGAAETTRTEFVSAACRHARPHRLSHTVHVPFTSLTQTRSVRFSTLHSSPIRQVRDDLVPPASGTHDTAVTDAPTATSANRFLILCPFCIKRTFQSPFAIGNGSFFCRQTRR